MRNLACLLPHPYVSLAFLIAFAYLLVQSPPVMSDTDVPWHLAAGDYIRDHGIPKTDPFSFSAGDITWINLSWLWDVGMSYVVEWGGMEGLRLLSITCMSLTLAIIMRHLIARGGLSASEVSLVVALVCLVLWPMAANARPQLASFLLVAWLHEWLYHATTKHRIRALYVIPLMTILWVNLHGGFIAVYIFLGLYFIQALKAQDKLLRNHLFIVGVLSVLAALVTPWHIHIVEGVLRTLDSVITFYIEEWQPLNIGVSIGFSLILFIYILLSDHQDNNVPLADRLIPVLWLVLAFESVRNFYYFAISAAPFLAHRFHLYNESQKGQGQPINPNMKTSYAGAALAGAALLFVVSIGSPLQEWVARKGVVGDSGVFSKSFFEEIARDYPDTRFFNDYNFGGYMIYYSDVKPFIDGRAGTAYPESLLVDFIDFQKMGAKWQEILKRHRIEGLILDNGSPYVQLYNLGGARDVLKLVKRNEHVSVFLFEPAPEKLYSEHSSE